MSPNLRLIPAAVALLLASCGGGSGTAPPSSAPSASTSSGVAVDGYLQFSSVLCDSNGNGVADAGERSVGTNAAGQFSFSPECTDPLVVSGGTSADTGLAFSGILRAPSGATVVSPLTTLVAEGLSADALVAALGLPAGTALLSTDPAAVDANGAVNPTLLRKTLAVQQLVQKTAELMGALSGQSSAAAKQALYAAVARSFASELANPAGGGAALSSGMTLDGAVLTRLVQAAAVAAAQLYPTSNPLNLATLAQVVAPGLAAQAETLLVADAATLVAQTAAAQSSQQISQFALANVAALAAAPGDASAALASSLSAQVDPYVAIAGDAIRLVNGGASTSHTFSQFQSDAGISVSWPLPEPMTLEVSLANAQFYAPMAGQKLSAAVSVTETAAGGQGTILAYIDEVAVERIGDTLKLTVPTNGASNLYGVSSDGNKKAVVNFGNSVRNVTGTFNSLPGVATSFPLGNIVNYTINQLSNDFTGMYSLRGKYRVTIVLAGMSLRLADGTQLPAASITVPTALNGSGAVIASHTVEGRGMVGYISLAD